MVTFQYSNPAKDPEEIVEWFNPNDDIQVLNADEQILLIILPVVATSRADALMRAVKYIEGTIAMVGIDDVQVIDFDIEEQT